MLQLRAGTNFVTFISSTNEYGVDCSLKEEGVTVLGRIISILQTEITLTYF
mgnify:CR=1 FL=1